MPRIKSTIRMLASMVSHMPLHLVWRESGVTQRHGFDLVVHVSNVKIAGQPFVSMDERAKRLLDGAYDYLSGLHHAPYHARAKGDRRLVYLAQPENEWDDCVVAARDVRSAKDLEGRRFIITDWDTCVYGNLVHSLELAGADPGSIEFIDGAVSNERASREAVAMVARGDASAAIVDPPFDLRAQRLGLRVLKLPHQPVIHNVTICANVEWVRQNEETTLAFLRSLIDAIHFFKTEKQRVHEILERHYAPLVGLDGREEVEHLQETWATLLDAKPYPHPLAVWNFYNLDIAHDTRVNFVAPLEPWDISYLRRIDDSGYVDRLYGWEEAGPPGARLPG